MRTRLRSLAALLALCALSLSTGGSAWAAMCAGAPAAAPAASAAGGHGDAHGHGHHGAAPAPPARDESERSRDGEAPACPLMAPGAAGSCLGTFVGAAPSAPTALADHETHDFPLPRPARGLRAPSPPFRPPEA